MLFHYKLYINGEVYTFRCVYAHNNPPLYLVRLKINFRSNIRRKFSGLLPRTYHQACHVTQHCAANTLKTFLAMPSSSEEEDEEIQTPQSVVLILRCPILSDFVIYKGKSSNASALRASLTFKMVYRHRIV